MPPLYQRPLTFAFAIAEALFTEELFLARQELLDRLFDNYSKMPVPNDHALERRQNIEDFGTPSRIYCSRCIRTLTRDPDQKCLRSHDVDQRKRCGRCMGRESVACLQCKPEHESLALEAMHAAEAYNKIPVHEVERREAAMEELCRAAAAFGHKSRGKDEGRVRTAGDATPEQYVTPLSPSLSG